MIDPLSPVAYLDKEPSEAELAQSQPAKVWQLVRVAMVAHSTKVWISGRRAFERRMRNMALASVAALIGGLCTCAATAQTHLKEVGAEQERNAEFGRRLDSLEHKVDVIQQTLMHSSDSDSTPDAVSPPRSDFFTDPGMLKIPNKFSFLDLPSMHNASINPRLCSNSCNSNLQCRSFIGGATCGVCVAGSCSQILPP